MAALAAAAGVGKKVDCWLLLWYFRASSRSQFEKPKKRKVEKCQ